MKARTAIVATEDQEQMAVLEFCDIWHMPYFHVNNEMWSTSIKQKNRATAMGVKKGVPDLFIFIPIGKALAGSKPVPPPGKVEQFDPQTYYQMVVVEMKRRKGSKTSPEQYEWRAIFQAANVPHTIAKGASEAIKFLQECQAYYKIKPAGGIQTR